jgi:uncharacterized RDD family membrane protein YckC
MSVSETPPDQEESTKARILNRFVSKAIDFLIIGVLLEAVPRVGFYAGMTYLLIGDGLFEGRSIGKRLIRLKVILQEKKQPCGFKESIIRNFPLAVGYILMTIPLIGFIFPLLVVVFEFLLILGSEKGMRLGDELAKTQVIEETSPVMNNES